MVNVTALETDGTCKVVWRLLEQVKDPEIPVLSVVNLGIVRAVEKSDAGVEIVITPTYTGCPAMDTITRDIEKAMAENGIGDVTVTTQLSPAWTTDWLDEEAHIKLKAVGIAPPEKSVADKSALFGEIPKIACPKCGSRSTEQVSAFGSTACKAHYRCTACLEPFDYFKCL